MKPKDTREASGFHVMKPKDRKSQEIVKLMIQELGHLGYENSSQTLEKESGEILEPGSVSLFKQGILSGDWLQVEELLEGLGISDDQVKLVKFMVSKQKYSELVHQGQSLEALKVLRSELATGPISESELKQLSNLLFVPPTEIDLKKSRNELLVQIQGIISSTIMIPERRLETLLDQAIEWQKHKCIYHNTLDESISLFNDHLCDKTRFPRETTRVLEEHSDEVWFISFSHDGKYLASASKDASAIVWNLDTFKPVHVLVGHGAAISFVCWSPNDKYLLTASNDNTLKLWNARTGVCEQTFSKHTEVVTSCAWLPSGNQFVSGSTDKSIYLWNVDGTVVFKWSGIRVHDLQVTNDGKMLIAIAEKKIRLFDLSDNSEVAQLQESDPITSIYLSESNRYALVNLCTQEIHLWDLKEHKFIRKYVGQKQGRFVIRSCFGGIQENFIMSGSEDSNIYVWHREHGNLLESLQGHSGCVNCVAWNSSRNAFASASDDNTIRYWT